MVATHVCAGCHGIISGTRRFTLSKAMTNHEKTCPSRRSITEPTKQGKKETNDDQTMGR